MGKMTKLTAVNTMLLSAGENLVADLTTQSGTDTEIALFLLDRTIEDYQLRGFATTIYQKKVNPDTNLKLLLPLDVIAVELVSSHYTSTDNTRIRARMMDGSPPYLYNVTEQTDLWVSGTEYTLEYTEVLAFEDIDLPGQKAITHTAARQYQLVSVGDLNADDILAQREQFFRIQHRAADVDDNNRNILSSSSGAAARAVRRGFGRVASNDPSRFRFWRTIN